MNTNNTFLKPGTLIDGDLTLVLVNKIPYNPVKQHSPCYVFEMRHTQSAVTMGRLNLRIDTARIMRYPGHIGYEVNKRFRGRRYAARSCRLIKSFAARHGLKALWLTVDPKNIASHKTCEIIGAAYIETVRIPKGHEMYEQGARFRRRYRLSLKNASS